MSAGIFEIAKAAGFDAAHRLPGALDGGGFGRLHGHSFRVEATLRGPAAAATGWVEDLALLEAALEEAAAELDHSLLNDHPGLENPTLEALCLFFTGRLGRRFPNLARIEVSRPTLGERCSLSIR